jgi:hypothetical protein
MILKERAELLSELNQINQEKFRKLALKVFQYQAKNNELYAAFLKLVNKKAEKITQLNEIPFLPIDFFKSKTIKSGNWESVTTFKSSGTSNSVQSIHHVKDLSFYLKNTVKGFTKFYGSPENYAILALLPSYLERGDSSLVLMAEHFIKMSKFDQSGFFLNDHKELAATLLECFEKNIPVLLLGVTFALLDFAADHPMKFPSDSIVMETGGMKGRRKEMIRNEVHQILSESFGLKNIHSEYGMTELFSQAYSKGHGIFYPSETMQILIRDSTDPFYFLENGKTGAVNIIDLANFDTCSFIATDDLGKIFDDGCFEILGRFDSGDIRGCNLMIG